MEACAGALPFDSKKLKNKKGKHVHKWVEFSRNNGEIAYNCGCGMGKIKRFSGIVRYYKHNFGWD
jgi:hypothetical protein